MYETKRMKIKKNFEEKVEELYRKWVLYKKDISMYKKDISKNALSLQGEIRSTRDAYTARFGEPSLLQRIYIGLDSILCKTVIFNPMRKIILEKDDKIYTLLSLNYLERFVEELYSKTKNGMVL